ncbi:MAG: dicarboxylate/amino acid:cation symporter [Patulibacter minatonensis]
MNFTWPGAATFAVVVVAWAGIWFLRKREVNFSLIALAALAIGIPIGLVAQEHVDAIAPIGKIYINVLLAVVAPLIFVAIVASITSLGTLAKLRSIGLRSIFWLLVSNALGVLLAIGLGLTFQPGSGVHNQLGTAASQTIEGQVQAFSQVVVGLFPTNVVENFSSNDIIPIILVALTLSVAYLAIAETGPAKAKPFADGAEALKLVIFKAVGYVIRLTPYAIVALTAHIVGTSANLGSNFWSLIGLLGLVWAACFIHAYAINAVILQAFANVPVVAFFKKIFPAQLTAFTTQSSVGTLPVTTTQLTQKVGVHSEIAHFTAPLGTTIGMPGCAGIWPVLIAIWGINAYDIPYTVQDYALLVLLAVFVSVGTAGVPGAATVAAATVLAAAGLPLEFVAVTIPISIIADTARTMNNVTAAAVAATVVARQTGMLDDEIFAGRKTPPDSDEGGGRGTRARAPGWPGSRARSARRPERGRLAPGGASSRPARSCRPAALERRAAAARRGPAGRRRDDRLRRPQRRAAARPDPGIRRAGHPGRHDHRSRPARADARLTTAADPFPHPARREQRTP